jgi:hypothetical protein
MFRKAPTQVQRAIVLLWASFALGTLDAVLNWEPLDPTLGEFEVIMWAILVGSVLFAAVLIYFVSRRHNWARILLLVLTVIGLAMYVVYPPELSIEPVWSIVVTVGITVMDIVAIYWLFSGSGAKWYSSPKTA